MTPSLPGRRARFSGSGQLTVITRIQIRRNRGVRLRAGCARARFSDFVGNLSPGRRKSSELSDQEVTRQLISLTSMNYGRNFLGNLFPFPFPTRSEGGGEGKGA